MYIRSQLQDGENEILVTQARQLTPSLIVLAVTTPDKKHLTDIFNASGDDIDTILAKNASEAEPVKVIVAKDDEGDADTHPIVVRVM